MKSSPRRQFLFSSLLAVAGTLLSQLTLAATVRKMFDANSVSEALNNLPEKIQPEASNRLLLGVPEISANPERIPVRLRSELPGTDLLILLSPSAVPPMIAQFAVPVGTEAEVRTQIRLKSTSTLQLVARAGGKLYTVQKEVKVAIPYDARLFSE